MMFKTYKIVKLQEKINKNFLDYISNEKTSFIEFLLKNKFTYSVKNNILIFYKFGICDNSILTYEDEDDIKKTYKKEFQSHFTKHLSDFDVNVDEYYELELEVENQKLIKFSKINQLANGDIINLDKIQQLISTNLLENAEISNKLDIEQIYLYKAEYKLLNIDKYLMARKKLNIMKNVCIFLLVSLIVFVVYMLFLHKLI